MNFVRFTPTPTRGQGKIRNGIYKSVEAVNTSAENGHAFIGPFLPGYRQTELIEGTIVVRKDYSKEGWLWFAGKVDANEACGIAWGDAWPLSQFLGFRDHVAALLSQDENWEGYDAAYAAEAAFVDLKDTLRDFFSRHHVDYPAELTVFDPETNRKGTVDGIGHLAQYLTEHFRTRGLTSDDRLPQGSPEIPVVTYEDDTAATEEPAVIAS